MDYNWGGQSKGMQSNEYHIENGPTLSNLQTFIMMNRHGASEGAFLTKAKRKTKSKHFLDKSENTIGHPLRSIPEGCVFCPVLHSYVTLC